MNKYKEYINILAVSLTLAIILFYKFINGEYVFVSGDTLAPQAIKHAIASLIEKNGFQNLLKLDTNKYERYKKLHL